MSIFAALGRPFAKMHGLGNDFVVVDGRGEPCIPSPEWIRWVCDRHVGIGGDQFLVIEPATVPAATARMRIYNVDGSEARTCLNASRCVSWILLGEAQGAGIVLETLGGLIAAAPAGELAVSLQLAAPRWDWQSIPLSAPVETLALDMASGPLTAPTAVSLGNPHLVCFVPDRDAVDVPRWAPGLYGHKLLPEGANIGVAEMAAPDRLRLVVWERPGILTQACGSGACAAVLAARRRGLTQARRVTVDMPGGSLHVEIHEDERITLTGPVAISYAGRVSMDLKVAA